MAWAASVAARDNSSVAITMERRFLQTLLDLSAILHTVSACSSDGIVGQLTNFGLPFSALPQDMSAVNNRERNLGDMFAT